MILVTSLREVAVQSLNGGLSREAMESDGWLVSPAVFKTVVGPFHGPGCGSIPTLSAISVSFHLRSETSPVEQMRPVYPDVVGRAGLSQPAAHGMQNIMLRRRAGTDAPYLHHRQHRDAPRCGLARYCAVHELGGPLRRRILAVGEARRARTAQAAQQRPAQFMNSTR